MMYFEAFLCFCLIERLFAQNEYTYRDQLFWGRDYPRCGGRNQSPIEIYTQNTIPILSAPLVFTGYTRPLPIPLRLRNDGHTADLSVVDEYDFFAPYVRGGLLNGVYQFKSLHFHWGSQDKKGSEHVINRKRYSLELHMVHKNIKYNSLAQASNYSDGWMVLTVLFQISAKDNLHVAPIVDSLQSIRNSSDATYFYIPLALKSLLANINTGKYYTYHGSQTSPPCNEVVTWIIFTQPSKISHTQLEKFRRLIGSNNQRILTNQRSSQPINDRPVYLRLGPKRRHPGG